jgi:Sec-independent protein translocase protein TatA
MFDVSWGEIAVVTGVGLALIGRKDLPRAAHVAGTQLGRVVGLLQGARARADRFAAHSELKQLQNELRLGLRELDAVKSELAVSMSAGGMMGRSLGATTSNASRSAPQLQQPPGRFEAASMSLKKHGKQKISAADNIFPPTTQPRPEIRSSVFQTTAAVAEQEWITQGIAFSSAAEQGLGVANFNREQAGSVILTKILQQSLIFDQYDRVVAEQDAALQSKVATVQAKHAAALQTTADPRRKEKKK